MASNQVLEYVRLGSETIGYIVEKSKREEDKIHVPVLFGENGKEEKNFEADAFNKEKKLLLK